MDFVSILVIAIVICCVFVFLNRDKNADASEGKKGSKGREKPANSKQIVDDIKLIKTSRVSDQVQILDDLDATSPGYRQYCELIGTSMLSGGVTAPYSKRQVAYYDLRCYRIESKGGSDVETLVAQEKSIEPFFFTDASCDTPIYIDLASFGENIILVNASDRIEGPNSDFAKAMAGAASSGNGAASSTVTAAVAQMRERGANVLADLRDHRLQAANRLQPVGLQPAYAGTGSPDGFGVAERHRTQGRAGNRHANRLFAGGPGGHGGPRGGMGGRPGGPGGNFGGMGNLGSFLGGAPQGSFGGPAYRGRGNDVGDTILSIGLGALIGSMAAQGDTGGSAPAQDNFRGYRVVEDVVPLGSPVYSLGEIYRNGRDVYMGKSVSKDYPSSYFACKPEAEVISHLEG